MHRGQQMPATAAAKYHHLATGPLKTWAYKHETEVTGAHTRKHTAGDTGQRKEESGVNYTGFLESVATDK